MGFLELYTSGWAWWDRIDESIWWQDCIFFSLGVAYSAIGVFALVQLARIQFRVPEYGWTTQKVFHLLNFVVNAVRAAVFFFRRDVQAIHPQVFTAMWLDLPGVLFFTTYTLLVRFWAEIYYQARSLPTDRLRPAFLITNAAVYAIQAVIWIFMAADMRNFQRIDFASKLFFAVVSLLAAAGFLLYGGRLFLMLCRFPIESKGRRKKLREVGCVTAICSVCFSVRAVMVAYSAFNKAADLDVLNHPILNAFYYTVVEIIPSALVLYILRKLPPKKIVNYHPIR
eukprot:TRINITY_DN310_c0_g1_i1.p1 TRINITY_DN310_c0_g1~~TRINITY_DN310_c0_g1_i1.p1  ORF type:complete len:283 (-),score=48.44 TRINITY_DN310_c0_g1_i1:519-1367(-)